MASLSRLDDALNLFRHELSAVLSRVDERQLHILLDGDKPMPQDLKAPIENAYRALGEITTLIWELRFGDRPVPIDHISGENLDFFHNRLPSVSYPREGSSV